MSARQQRVWDLCVAPSRRGMAELLPAVGIDCFDRAAAALLAGEDAIVIGTGFPVNGAPETDGPPGAFALADALIALGREVTIASYDQAIAVMRAVRPELTYLAVPIVPAVPRSPPPGQFLAIEICGATADGSYRNMHGDDVTAAAPKFEALFGDEAFIAIGDGGNEFGMGSAPADFFARWRVVPPVSHAAHLLPATTSNFGAYALVEALGRAMARDLLPRPDRETATIHALVAAGSVDGFTGDAQPLVDGRDLHETEAIVTQLC